MTTRFLSHIGIQVPDGWLPSEAMAATRGDGAAVLRVWCAPTAAVDADEVANRHGEAMAGELLDYDGGSVEHVVTTDGARAMLRRAEAGPSGERVAHAVLYTVSGPWAYVAHVCGPLDEADALVDLLHGVTPAGLGPAPAPVNGQGSTPIRARSGETFTVEELVAVAELCRVPSLLGYDRRVFAGLTRGAVALVVRTAARSLLARRVLRRSADGRYTVAVEHEATLGVALRHDEWVQATAQDGATKHQASWAVRGVDGVALTGPIGSELNLEPFPASELADRVGAFAGLAPSASFIGDVVTVPSGALDAVLRGDQTDAAQPVHDSLGGAVRAVRLRHLVRTGAGVRGREETWLLGSASAAHRRASGERARARLSYSSRSAPMP